MPVAQQPPLLEVRQLKVTGQEGFVLDVPHLCVDQPGVTVLIGRNGSGKSTFLEAVLDVINPEQGDIQLLGQRLAAKSGGQVVRDRLGAQIQSLSWNLTIRVDEILAIHKAVYGRSDPDILDGLGIVELARSQYRRLSTGQKRRVDLAFAMAHRPTLLFLDEPGSGLDRTYLDAYLGIIQDLVSDGAHVLLASHDRRDLELARQVIWFERGSVVRHQAPQAMLADLVGTTLCRLETAPARTAAQIRQAVAPLAQRVWEGPDGTSYSGDTRTRQAFIAIAETCPESGYATRQTRVGDLLELIRSDCLEGAL